jgi:Zn finger protein HypA/HybF involved in hydrogenase expression
MKKMKEKVRMLNCPFCGSDSLDIIENPYLSADKIYLGVCNDCDAWGPEHGTIFDALCGWNSRVGKISGSYQKVPCPFCNSSKIQLKNERILCLLCFSGMNALDMKSWNIRYLGFKKYVLVKV